MQFLKICIWGERKEQRRHFALLRFAFFLCSRTAPHTLDEAAEPGCAALARAAEKMLLQNQAVQHWHHREWHAGAWLMDQAVQHRHRFRRIRTTQTRNSPLLQDDAGCAAPRFCCFLRDKACPRRCFLRVIQPTCALHCPLESPTRRNWPSSGPRRPSTCHVAAPAPRFCHHFASFFGCHFAFNFYLYSKGSAEWARPF